MAHQPVVLDVDASAYHVMQTFVRGDTYAFLVWPKNLPLSHLEHVRQAVNFQLDVFIEGARRETEEEEAARLEVESWRPVLASHSPVQQEDQGK